MEEQLKKKWFAVYTKPRWEKKVNSKLMEKKVESWCPVQKKESKWSDRRKIIDDPLFKSYVFVHISEDEKIPVLTTNGVVRFVSHLKKPAVIRDEEIELIRSYLMEKDAQISVENLHSFSENNKVIIRKGVFMDMEGTVTKSGPKKVYVRLESLEQLMIVEFPLEHLAHKTFVL
ncbi:MAG: UpxY family transcription antiterminator [Bacteroidetes bacterium]|nr:UpxY family transcription antiterminator [Bacteroidota bacterium]